VSGAVFRAGGTVRKRADTVSVDLSSLPKEQTTLDARLLHEDLDQKIVILFRLYHSIHAAVLMQLRQSMTILSDHGGAVWPSRKVVYIEMNHGELIEPDGSESHCAKT